MLPARRDYHLLRNWDPEDWRRQNTALTEDSTSRRLGRPVHIPPVEMRNSMFAVLKSGFVSDDFFKCLPQILRRLSDRAQDIQRLDKVVIRILNISLLRMKYKVMCNCPLSSLIMFARFQWPDQRSHLAPQLSQPLTFSVSPLLFSSLPLHLSHTSLRAPCRFKRCPSCQSQHLGFCQKSLTNVMLSCMVCGITG